MRHPINQLTTVYTDSTAVGQFKQRGTAALTGFRGVVKSTAGDRDILTIGDPNTSPHLRRVPTEGIATHCDQPRLLDKEVSIAAGIDGVASESDSIAAAEVDVV